MQQAMQEISERGMKAGGGLEDRRRVEKVVETLASVSGTGENLAEVTHDARNMVTALGLYCDLLDEPGVIAVPFVHYAQELRLVAAASRRLVEKLMALDASVTSAGTLPGSLERAPGGWSSDTTSRPAPFGATALARKGRWDLVPSIPVANLAAELLANRNLLAALAGPTVVLTVDAVGGAQPVRLTAEDVTRVLVNLVKNAAEAMPGGGRVHIALREQPPSDGAVACVELTVEDNGPGIPEGDLERIFTSGYGTHTTNQRATSWPVSHRGLGLAITRSIVEEAGGRVFASNRPQGGARFSLELPVSNARG
jgi:signal transduction histidine kinase